MHGARTRPQEAAAMEWGSGGFPGPTMATGAAAQGRRRGGTSRWGCGAGIGRGSAKAMVQRGCGGSRMLACTRNRQATSAHHDCCGPGKGNGRGAGAWGTAAWASRSSRSAWGRGMHEAVGNREAGVAMALRSRAGSGWRQGRVGLGSSVALGCYEAVGGNRGGGTGDCDCGGHGGRR